MTDPEAAVAPAAGTGPDDTSRDASAAPERSREGSGVVAGEGSDGSEADGALTDELHAGLLEMAWGVIANAGWNAGTGDTDLPKTTGWHERAVRWRDDYHRWLDLHLRPGGYRTWEELALSLTRERDALFVEVTGLRRALQDTDGAEPHAPARAVPDATLDRAADAAMARVRDYQQEAREIIFPFPSRGWFRAVVEAAAPVIAAAERERIAGHPDVLAANYPEDVFPPDSGSRDAIGGTAMRHAYRNAARTIREGGHLE